MSALFLRTLSPRAVVLLAGLLAAVPAGAQPVRPPRLSGMLGQAMRSNWLQVEITSGRIAATSSSFGGTRSTSTAGSRSERLAINGNEGRPNIDYELGTPTEQFTLSVKNGNRIVIIRVPKGDGHVVPVEFRQDPDAPVTLAVGTPAERREYRAASIWHLLIIENQAALEHLVPLLDMVRPEWRLADRAAELEEELLRLAMNGQVPDRQRWNALLAQLGDDRFAKREAADRELREAGATLLPYLQQLDFRRLDAEQQFRVRRIIASLGQDLDEDAAEQVAAWMVADPDVWWAMLSRGEESTRRTAAAQLSRLLGSPIDFDPAAPDAVRQRQIERLRKK